ncbi:LacI family DNA-binding transcriptional regulator [uncultured Serinicoccus sp.]|uniref:LacI family DNA-binding transcriptional regulator n=1 Tax=uncultured Serinicoccus sp. TaxID=735514 RepID=UPI002606B4E0|nr:LacI family DNA-binding transcriptional regulator [uncultured Serinicoccus sp.]
MTSLTPRRRISGPTLRDVAALAGVSLKTASRVLNDGPNVSSATRQAVQDAMESLAYEPDPAARSLRAGHDRTVGVVVDSIGDIFFSELAATLESVLDAAGYSCLLASSNRQEGRERDIVRSLVRRRCAGVIVAPTTPASISAADLAGTPVVFVDRVGHVEGAASVVSDDPGMAFEATRHLLAHGHRRVALLSDSLDLPTTRGRQEGYRRALTEAGVEVAPELMRMECDDESSAMRQVRQVLDLADPATAIFSCSSRLSLGVVPALHQFGRTDVALVSFGDFTMADSVQPAVTVVDHSARRIAQTAAEALLAHLPPHDPAHGPTGVIEVPARLIPRGTGEIAAPPTRQQMSRA